MPNILLCDRTAHSPGQVYLVDFGAAQAALPNTEGTFTVVGSYGYTAPEQFAGRATTASDLYSLGATLVHLVTGQHPADLPRKRSNLELKGVLSGDPLLKQWLKKLLNFDSEERFIDAQAALSAMISRESGHQIITLDSPPADALCHINATDQTFTILAPIETASFFSTGYYLIFGMILTTASVLPHFSGFTAYAIFLGIILGFTAVGDFLLRRHRRQPSEEIKLHIDTNDISLSKVASKVGQADICLRKHPRAGQIKVERVTTLYVSSMNSQRQKDRRIRQVGKAYVQIVIQSSDSTPDILIAIGDRKKAWLSPAESRWLSTALGDWLDCPVTEVEVREYKKFG